MKITDTISVNPSKTAMGHVDTPASTIFRSQIIGTEPQAHTIDLVKVIFPSCSTGMSEFRKYEVPLRTLFATILIVVGITMLTSLHSISATPFAICTLVFGAFLALGFLTRPLMAAAAIFYCVMGALSIRSGSPDISVFSLMFGCLVFCVSGAGKYSCDTLLRKSINRHKNTSIKKKSNDLMGYKAFHQVKF